MYTYKYITVPHSVWTGKPEESIEAIIDDYAAHGWRLVQVLREMTNSGRKMSKIIFEREVPEDYYKKAPTPPRSNPEKYDAGDDDFV